MADLSLISKLLDTKEGNAPITADLAGNISRIIATGEASTDTYSVSDVLIAVVLPIHKLELEVTQLRGSDDG